MLTALFFVVCSLATADPGADSDIPDFSSRDEPLLISEPASLQLSRDILAECSLLSRRLGGAMGAENATDAGGDDCTWYATRPHLCGCCDDYDFRADRCAECQAPAGGERGPSAVTLEQALRDFPSKTTVIDLPGRFLSGSLPTDLHLRFPNLTKLDLARNRLTGSVPGSIWSLPHLRELVLGTNSLEGTLSGIGSAANLRIILVPFNSLSGPLPESMGALTKLLYVDLSNNRFTGSIPSSWGQWKMVKLVRLDTNQLTGTIPEALGSWSELQQFVLHRNKVTGTLPEELRNWQNVKEVSVAYNSLTGTFPPSFAAWTKVQIAVFAYNDFVGIIPEAVGAWSDLKGAYFNDNRFSGPLPKAVGNWTRVNYVFIRNNQLTGPLPEEVGSWRLLDTFDFGGNQLTGLIPQAVGNWTRLRILMGAENRFSGPLPNEVGAWRLLIHFSLGGNSLSGPLPDSVGNWSYVNSMTLAMNKLSGQLPETIGHWGNVRYVFLNGNSFSGHIPRSVGGWSSIQRVSLANNNFSGEIPEEVQSWKNALNVAVSENDFSGPLPQALGSWSQVEIVYAYGNRFTSIPSDLGNLTKIQRLYLSRNSLSFLPDMSTLTQLTAIDLFDNSLTAIGGLPQSLKTLELAKNQLAEFPTALYGLASLEVLDLSRNNISYWPPAGVVPNRYMSSQTICGIQPLQARFHWPKLKRLDVSHNNLAHDYPGVRELFVPSIRVFISSLAYLESLTEVTCRNCRLSGILNKEGEEGLSDDQPHTGDKDCGNYPPRKPGFLSLQSLDLAGNDITAIHATPTKNLLSVDFSNNALEALDISWFNTRVWDRVNSLKIYSNPMLRMQVQPPSSRCNKSGATELTADPDTYVPHPDGSYECTSLCSGILTKYSTDSDLDEAALCRCLPGYAGQGKNCTACPADSYSSWNESDEHRLLRHCQQCPADSGTSGQVRVADISACRCPAGSYLDKAKAACVRCGQWPYRATELPGSESAAACGCNASYGGLKEFGGLCGCDDGKYMNQVSRRCENCSQAEQCLWGTDIGRSLRPPLTKQGFWAEPVEDISGFAKNSIWRCTSAGSCARGGRCAEGRWGRACGLCRANMHGAPDGPCEPCPRSPTSQRWALGLGVVAMLVPTIMLLHLGLVAKESGLRFVLHLRAVRGSLKQMVKHIQTISVISSFDVSWPPVARALFHVLSNLTIQVPVFLAVGCLDGQTSATLEMYAKWSLPLIFAGSAFVAMPTSWAVAWALRRLERRVERRGLGKLWAKRVPAPHQVEMGLKDVARVLLFSVTIFWSTLATSSLEILTCTPSPNGILTVHTYPHVRCNYRDAEFVHLATTSVFIIVLYLFLPLVILIRAYNKSATVLASTVRADRGWYAYLFEDFRDGHLVWSVVIMVKDMLFVIVPAALPGHGAAQLLVTAALSASHICLVLQSRPFQERSNTLLEAWNGATAAALCIYSVGMGYENTAGMDDVTELFDQGSDDPLYKSRAVGMVIVQVIAVIVPAGVLLAQLLCAIERTRDLMPRIVLPVSQKEAEQWLQDFVLEAGIEDTRLVNVLKNFDEADLYAFRHLFTHTSATLGNSLSSGSASSLVKRASRLSKESLGSSEKSERPSERPSRRLSMGSLPSESCDKLGQPVAAEGSNASGEESWKL